MPTIFSKIIDGDIPADVVWDDAECLAFRDINPAAPTHILVIPKKPLVNLADARDDDAALLGHLLRVAAQVAAQEGLKDYRVVTNNGAGAGQSVFHLHLHVIGGRALGWPPG
ncbi:MAG: histidine triad nucleotide-binding protein [Myxococcales bacterium]|nr:histidine triad nucleotide-binding protein [Myxococcales bacterium]MCB9524486.1 histidine triad nucleotide-binding protein [Myxococcales bacterium]